MSSSTQVPCTHPAQCTRSARKWRSIDTTAADGTLVVRGHLVWFGSFSKPANSAWAGTSKFQAASTCRHCNDHQCLCLASAMVELKRHRAAPHLWRSGSCTAVATTLRAKHTPRGLGVLQVLHHSAQPEWRPNGMHWRLCVVRSSGLLVHSDVREHH